MHNQPPTITQRVLLALIVPLLICAGVGRRVCLCEHTVGIEQTAETSHGSCCSAKDAPSPLLDGPEISEAIDDCCCQVESPPRIPISSIEALTGDALSDRLHETVAVSTVPLPGGFAALDWLLSAPMALTDSKVPWPDRVRLFAKFESYLC